MKIYLAGPMTGFPDYNRTAFAEAAAFLRAKGLHVYNPGETPVEIYHLDPGTAWQENLEYICIFAEALVYLPGSHDSEGAKIEIALAKYLGIRVVAYEGFKGIDL